MEFRIYDTLYTIQYNNPSLSDTSYGLPMFYLTTPDVVVPVTANFVSGLEFTLLYDYKLTAFSISNDLWKGDGDTRDCGIYLVSDTTKPLIKVTVNKQTDKIINNEYFHPLTEPISLTAGVPYVIASTMKEDDIPPGENTSFLNLAVISYTTMYNRISNVITDDLIFPSVQSSKESLITPYTICNGYLTII